MSKNNIKKTNPTLGYRRGNWEGVRPTKGVDAFFCSNTGYSTLEAFYKRTNDDDRITINQFDYKWRPYWMIKDPEMYQPCTRSINRGEE